MSSQRYLVTARKYRPQTFQELVAQEHVTETLKNAIRLDRLAHAYLFSGPRGVGKTTAARILAKAINCTTPLDERADEAEPCRVCDSCRSFEEGRSLNIIEIDAASNNKVEDVRDLRETVRIPPQGSRKKVYIVDEVHMLSNAAFNALLKTLEEPPPHVLFIFATTEPHKVLATILSRCQRFDFRRIPVPDTVARLRQVCAEEGITADEASLLLVARKGDGALRDALSAFDQAVSLCGASLVYDELAQALGVVGVDLYFDVTRFIDEGDAAGMLRLVESIVRSGYDLQEFLVGLAEHLRNLIVAHTMGGTELIEAAEATRHRYEEVSGRFAEADLLRLLMIAGDTEERLKSSVQPRLQLEMALLKMAHLRRSVDLQEALARLARLEELARDGRLPADLPPDSPPHRPATTAAAPQPRATGGPDRPTAPQPPSSPRDVGPPSGALPNAVREPAATSPAPAAGPDPEPTGQPVREPAGSRAGAGRLRPMPPSDPAPRSQDAPLAALARPDDSDPHDADPEDAALAGPELSAPPRREGPAADPEAGLSPGVRSGPDAARSASADGAESAPRTPPVYPDLFGAPALKRRSSPSSESSAVDIADTVGSVSDGGSGPVALPVATVTPLALRRLQQEWPRFVDAVKHARIHVGSLLQHTEPAALEGDELVVSVPDDFHHRLLSSQTDFLLEHLKGRTDETIRAIRFAIHERPVDELETPATDAFDPYEYMQRKRQENPVVRAIFDQFGGEIVW